MPELKHHFRAGKMNKDLDERLVPNGEYRDAQNIEISTSEGDDVGSVQNVVGNTKIVGKTYDSNSQSITANWSGFGLTNAKTIGSVVDNEHDKIYWFVTADNADCIIEYDDVKGIISPVLVDTNDILNFTSDQYITGINVLEGMLLWTDNKSEPKKIDINIFKSGCAGNFTTHTKYTGDIILSTQLSAASAFTEEHITVAKQAPITAPTLTMAKSKRGGNGTGTSPVIVSNSTAGLFADADGNGKQSGTSVNLNFTPAPNFQVGDIVVLTAQYEEQISQINYEIKGRITSLSNGTQTASLKILSIPVEVAYVPLVWEVLLEEDDVIFEKKMVRFGYRWKYTSGEYSVFSPFSELAFLPSTFEYLSSDGFNVGMINNLRDLKITIPSSYPVDVEEIDILYKESNANNIYVVDTLKRDSYNSFDLEYQLKSDLISKTVETNQILRPWDNVPRKAKAQEVTANRLIYGNYLQQYNIPNYNLPDITLSIDNNDITTVKEPELSIKTLRTYQAGVVYIDKYNRQSPVFTNDTASIQLPKKFADKVNKLKVSLSNTPPEWATHFKYYIKEPSNEYYNLAMDRYYLAEDGNVWLSFPSSERNKVQEDMYLILKKQHDSDVFVEDKARYKILDIQNEAPDFIKLVKRANAAVDCLVHDSGIPQVGSTSFKFKGPDPLDNPGFAASFTSDNLIQLIVAGGKSAKYQVVSGGYTGETDGSGTNSHIYSVTVGEPLKEGETHLDGLADGDSITIVMYEEKFKRKPEHYGRFFVKINRDSAFETNIIDTFQTEEQEWGIKTSQTIDANNANTGAGSSIGSESWFDTSDRNSSLYITQANNGHPKIGRNTFKLYRAGAPGQARPNRRKHDKGDSINAFLKALDTPGTYIRFKNSSGQTGEIYEITNSVRYYQYRRTSGKKYFSAKRREYVVTFKHWKNEGSYEDSFTFPSSGTNFNNAISEIQIMEKVIDQDNEMLTSTNPAIWETEPKETTELDLYYETGSTYAISQHGTEHELAFKNCYSFGNGVESDRLRDDFNAIKIDKGVKVSTVFAEQYKEEQKKNGLIYSGIFNSTSGTNRLNQFIQGEAITKDLNPHYGGIQKLHARNTDLVVLCEDKCLKVLANKDALFEAGGNAQLTSTNRVLGQTIPFSGNYGISKNPESFAEYAFRMYFTDKNRGAVIRLSMDGITPISDAGMRDYFNDNLPTANKLIGSYDTKKGAYNLTLPTTTVCFDEKINGWPSFKSFIPEAGVSLNNKYFTMYQGELWIHNNPVRNSFYGAASAQSSVTLLINDISETIKGFKTLNYSGSRSRVYTYDYDNATETFTPGWFAEYINTDQQEGFVKQFIKKENRYYNSLKGVATQLSNLDSQEFSVQGLGQFTGSLSGDVSLSDRTVTTNLTGIANATVEALTFDVEAGQEIHSTKSSGTITITPNTGFTLTASDFSVSSTGSYVDSVSFAQSGDNVIATVNFTDGVNMPTNDLTINLAVTGDAAAIVYRLHDLNFDINNDSNITVTKTYSGSSNKTAEPVNSATGFEATYDGSTFETVATVEFDLASTHEFKRPPQYKILKEDDLIESQYEITYQDKDASNADITIGVGGKTLNDVDKRIFTVKYKFPAQDTSKDNIQFNAISVQRQATQDNKINGYRWNSTNTVSRYAQTINLYVYGFEGATFTLKQVIDGGTAKYWDGDSFETSSTTLTIPSGGIYTIPVEFFETSTSKAYVFTIAGVGSTSLLSPLMGNVYNTATPPVVQNPFTINQFADVTLTVAATSSNMTVTSSNFTQTSQALSSPNEESDVAKLDVTFTATATGNISQVTDAEIEDFSNYNSNNFNLEFAANLPTINNVPATKTLSYTGSMLIDNYGSADTTMSLNLDNFFNVAGGSGGSILLNSEVTGAGGGFINIGKLTYNDGTYSTTNGKVIHVGTADNTSISGTGTIYGNFFGNGINDITLAITPGTGNTDTGTSCFDNMTITKGTLSGSDASQDLTYTWTAQFDETITSSSIPDYNVQVSLTNEP
tara:strand:- start:9473 stop:15475 length:6003 start_codon:yes stop_codon:yes gene_type:complete